MWNRSIHLLPIFGLLVVAVLSMTGCFGNDEDTAAPASATPAATMSAVATATSVGRFSIGTVVLVVSHPDCLNMRQGPSLNAPLIDCIADGQRLTVREGPREVERIRWWRVSRLGANGEGWVAEDYLRPTS